MSLGHESVPKRSWLSMGRAGGPAGETSTFGALDGGVRQLGNEEASCEERYILNVLFAHACSSHWAGWRCERYPYGFTRSLESLRARASAAQSRPRQQAHALLRASRTQERHVWAEFAPRVGLEGGDVLQSVEAGRQRLDHLPGRMQA